MALEFVLNRPDPRTADTDCVVVGAYADKSLPPSAQALDAASGGRLSALLDRGDVSGKPGRTALLPDVPGVTAPRVLVVGLGEPGKFAVPQYLKAVGDAVRALRIGPVKSMLLTLTELAVPGRDADWNVRQAAAAADHAAYEYTATRSKKAEVTLARVVLAGDAAREAAFNQGVAIAAGVRLTRELGNLPPNICNPAYLAAQAQALAAEFAGVQCEVLEREQMQALGMTLEPRALRADRRGFDVLHDLDGVRISHREDGNFDSFPIHIQGFNHGRRRRSHVDAHLAVVLQARDDGPAQRLDAQLALRAEALVLDELHEAARAVAALLHLAAVGVEDTVAEIAVPAARLDHQDLVAADAEMPVREAPELGAGERERLLRGVDDHEIVSGAVHLGERELHASAASTRAQIRSTAASSSSGWIGSESTAFAAASDAGSDVPRFAAS